MFRHEDSDVRQNGFHHDSPAIPLGAGGRAADDVMIVWAVDGSPLRDPDPLRAQIRSAADGRMRLLVLNFAGVDALDPTEIAGLTAVVRRCAQDSVPLRVVADEESLRDQIAARLGVPVYSLVLDALDG